MSGRRTWLGLAAVGLVIAVVVVLRGPTGAGDSPQHLSTSDAPNGTSALVAYAQALGHPTRPVEASFELPGSPALLFVFSPGPFNADQAQQLSTWIASGGVVIYASEEGEPQVDTHLGLHRERQPMSAAAHAPAPILGGVQRVTGAETARPFASAAAQVPLLRNDAGDILGLMARVGHGELIALADPLELCNAYLEKSDNWRLAADLIALAPAGSPVLFDEFHHGAVGSLSPQVEWMTTPWGAGLLWLVAVLFIGLALRGRGFGPPIPLRPVLDRSTAEYAAAVGGLLRRSGAKGVTLETLDTAARRALAERLGVSVQPDGPNFQAVLEQRAPRLADELASVESRLPIASSSEESLLEAAQALHAVAYPASHHASAKESS